MKETSNFGGRIPVAMYVRYACVPAGSENRPTDQEKLIRRYASRHNMKIVAAYMDIGKSGLSPDGCDDLKRLMAEIQSGSAPFKAVLLPDITRWGRCWSPENCDYYEFACSSNGIDPIYIADGSTTDSGYLETVVRFFRRILDRRLKAGRHILQPETGVATGSFQDAMYVPMPTEHSQYPMLIQTAAMEAYAAQHNFDFVKTYTDSRRSFIPKVRAWLRKLMANVQSGRK